MDIVRESGWPRNYPPGLVTTRADVDRLLNVELEMLKTEQIDYYLLHGLNGGNWNKMNQLGVCEFLDQAKADGRIRYGGFSFHGDIHAFRDIVDAYDWEVCLIQYNCLDEKNQAGTEGHVYDGFVTGPCKTDRCRIPHESFPCRDENPFLIPLLPYT
jgi:predicted aldo/keto reductase-like oxidoreductase